jgi:hypothetical protein
VKFNRGASLVLLLALVALGDERQGQVRVHVADAYGNPMPARIITLTGEDGTTIEATQDKVFSARYGTYTVKVAVQGFSTAVDMFAIDQPNQILAITMKLGVMEVPPPRCSIMGSVTKESGITRIRLLQLFGTHSIDVPASADGSFRFQNLECGDYMLIAIDLKGCVSTKMSRATVGGTHTDFDVSELREGACVTGK